MEHIGQRIKDLRKKADMTQDRLADYLGVSAQAVSKWECDISTPDLSLIPPLCRVLGCTSDELLGIRGEDEDPREHELYMMASGNDGNPDRFDTRLHLQKCLAAVEEYPRNLWLHYYCAMNEMMLPDDPSPAEGQAKTRREHVEAAEKRYRFILEETEDDGLRACVINNLVLFLVQEGRREEAAELARICPDLPNIKISKDYLLLFCLEGEERRRHWQVYLRGKLGGLMTALRMASHGEDEVRACEVSIAILDLLFPDGNLMDLNNVLQQALYRLVLAYGERERYDDMMRTAKQYCEVCAEIDRINALPSDEVFPFTEPLFDLLGCAPPIQSNPVPLREEAAEFLRGPRFDVLGDRAEYRALLERFPLLEKGTGEISRNPS